MQTLLLVTRLFGLLLALMFGATPTVDMVCRSLCTPDAMAAVAPSCHEVVSQTADGVLLPAVACQRDVVAAVAPADGTRNLVPPAPLVTAQVTAFLHVAAPAGCDINRLAVRPRPPQAYPSSTIVLRI